MFPSYIRHLFQLVGKAFQSLFFVDQVDRLKLQRRRRRRFFQIRRFGIDLSVHPVADRLDHAALHHPERSHRCTKISQHIFDRSAALEIDHIAALTADRVRFGADLFDL